MQEQDQNNRSQDQPKRDMDQPQQKDPAKTGTARDTSGIDQREGQLEHGETGGNFGKPGPGGKQDGPETTAGNPVSRQ